MSGGGFQKWKQAQQQLGGRKARSAGREGDAKRPRAALLPDHPPPPERSDALLPPTVSAPVLAPAGAHDTPDLLSIFDIPVSALKSSAVKSRTQPAPAPAAPPDPGPKIQPRKPRKAGLSFTEPGHYAQAAEEARQTTALAFLLSDRVLDAGLLRDLLTNEVAAFDHSLLHPLAAQPAWEWWDAAILQPTAASLADDDSVNNNGEEAATLPVVNEAHVTDLIHHPLPFPLPAHLATDAAAAPLPTYLTKAERVKWQRRMKQETEKQKRLEISLGLREAPPPRVRLSNLPRTLGPQASQDPTGVTLMVMEQTQARIDAHNAANASRKLTKEQRRAKQITKMQADQAHGLFAALLLIGDGSPPKLHFKLKKMSEKQLLSGVLIKLTPQRALVLAEGGTRGLDKWVRWFQSHDEQMQLVWRGQIDRPAYKSFSIHLVTSPLDGLKILRDHGVDHYWKLALQNI